LLSFSAQRSKEPAASSIHECAYTCMWSDQLKQFFVVVEMVADPKCDKVNTPLIPESLNNTDTIIINHWTTRWINGDQWGMCNRDRRC
jgi:hypothetical protein